MASLAEALYTLPTERLRTLIEARGVALNRLALTPGKRQLVQFLAGEISKANSVIPAIAQCNARELRLLQLILSCDAGSEVAWERVLAMAGGAALEEALSGVMTRLEDLGLAFRLPPDKVYLPDPVRGHIPVSLPDRYSLARSLDAYDFPTLKRIYFNLALGKEPGSKPETIEAIRAHLLQDDKGMRLKNPLDAEEVAVLEYLIQNGGWATPADVATAVLQGRTEEFFRYDWQNRWKQGRERNGVDHLLARGILHVVAHGYAFNLYLVLPGDLMRALTGDVNTAFWTRPLDTPTPLPAPPTAMTRHNGLLRDVVSLFAFLAHQEAVRTNTGHIHKSSLKNLARALSLPDERYAGFLYAVCREAKLIAPEGEKQAYSLTERGESWLHADATTQIRALFEGWRAGDVWAEMYNEPLIKVGDYRPRENILRMRHALLSLLASCPAENAYDLSTLADVLAFRHPLMLAQSAALGPDLVASPALFVKRLVGECLASLGLVELGRAEVKAAGQVSAEAPTARKSASGVERGKPARKPPEPEIAAFRLTPLGAHLLGVAGAEAPAEEPRENKVIVQANAEIFIPPYLDPNTLYQLMMLTELPAKGGTSNTVRLTRESIRSALDNGLSARELLSFLQTCARTGIPQNIEYLIHEVADRHGHIHIGKAQMYVQVDSPLLLQELQARKEFKPYFVRALSDTVALLQGEDTDKLLRELRKAGYLPVSDDPPVLHARKTVPGASLPPSQLLTSAPAQKRPEKEAKEMLDWNRIAKEDGKPYHAPAPAAKAAKPAIPARAVEDVSEEPTPAPANVVRDRTQIGVLMAQAAQGRKCVEIAYKRMSDVFATRRVIEPRVVLGDFVSAFCRESQSYDSFNIKRMQWARLTGQAFEEG